MPVVNPVMPASDLVPPGGLKFYQLGMTDHERDLKTYLEKTDIHRVFVVDAVTERRVLLVRKRMETSLNPSDQAPMLFHLASADRLENLKSILHLGVDPRVANASSMTAVIYAINMCNFSSASAFIDCRPWIAHDDVEVVQWRDRAKSKLTLKVSPDIEDNYLF